MDVLGLTYLLHINWRDKSVTHLTVETTSHESTYDLLDRLRRKTALGGAWYSHAAITIAAIVSHTDNPTNQAHVLRALVAHCPICKLTRKETNCE